MTRAIVVALLAGALCVAAGTVLGIIDFRDVGYPDSSNILRVGEFVRTGHLYPNFDKPPYLVTLYGPLMYVVLAVPYEIAGVYGMRLAEAGTFAACLWLVFAIGQREYGERRAAWMCVLLASSSAVFASWTTQIRGDLPGLACSLLGIYLALRAPRLLWAGVFAGLAIAVKQTFAAALLSVVIWLLAQRRFKQAGQFAATAAITVACGYGIALWREPLMLKHLMALRSAILDPAGVWTILFEAVRQPVVLFAIAGAYWLVRDRSAERALLLLYSGAAWIVATVTVVQAGGNINYFWEPLLVSGVLAAAGLRELERRSSIWLGLLTLLFIPAVLHDFYYLRTSVHQAASYESRRRQWNALKSALQGKRLLSTFPDVAILGAPPEMPDPFMNTELERSGLWDARPVLDGLRSGAYDVLVTAKDEDRVPQSYRGIPLWSNSIWSAAKRAYRPGCVVQDRFTSLEAWLPNGSLALLPQLAAAGCRATR